MTLLATAASHNAWDYDRLANEWDAQRSQVLQTDFNKSLAATIELSLSSPSFSSLGPDARDLLGVVAFFPQGINEKNLDWLFPTITNRKNAFDKFCVLSLTHRSDGFLTMLAPIRDYLGPQHPQSSSLLCATREQYIRRLSISSILPRLSLKRRGGSRRRMSMSSTCLTYSYPSTPTRTSGMLVGTSWTTSTGKNRGQPRWG